MSIAEHVPQDPGPIGPDGHHPLHAELLLFMRQLYRPFKRDKIDRWIFVGINDIRIVDFDGVEIRPGAIEFSGSIRDRFWHGFIEPFLEEMIRRIVEHSVKLADERGFERVHVLRTARGLSRSLVNWTYHSMDKVEMSHARNYYRKYKQGLPRTDSGPMVQRMHAFADTLIAGWPPVAPARAVMAVAGSAQTVQIPPVPSAGSSRPWASKRKGGPPLRGWHAICSAMNFKNTPKRRASLKRLNDRTAGPISWVGRVPEVDPGELAAWIEDTAARAQAAETERAKRREAARDLDDSHPEHLRDQALHRKARRAASP